MKSLFQIESLQWCTTVVLGFSVTGSRNFAEVLVNLIIGLPGQIFVWVFDSYWLAAGTGFQFLFVSTCNVEEIFLISLCTL